jgi:hypothetical protein
MKAKHMLMLTVLIIALAACSAGVASYPTPPEPTATPAQAPAAATSVAPQAAATPTQAAASPAGVLPGGDLTEADLAKILQDSFTAYPWRMNLTTTSTSGTATTTGTIEAQSPERVETSIEQPVDSSQAMIDIIVISPTLYVKVTGLPAAVLQTLGLKDGQWAQISTTQDTLGLAKIALAAANPAQLLNSLGYQGLLNQPNPSEQVFTLVGTEEVNGVQTNAYEAQASSGGTMTTTRVNIGVDDGRIYRIESQGLNQTVTTTMEYDSSISIQAPIP